VSASLAPGAALQRGFTMTELITVIVIVGIMGAMVAPRFFDNDVFQSRGAADQARAALRYAQKMAIAQRRPVRVIFTSASPASCDGVLVVNTINCVISDKVVIATALPKTVTFNALGQPVPPNAADSITVGGNLITIEAETGYVH
jgi:MSHA pilin protein MshC